MLGCGFVVALVYASTTSVRVSRASPRAASQAPSFPPIKTVFLIMMENQDWSSIKGSPDAPYINHALLPEGPHAEQYFTPLTTAGSLSNYLWIEAATDFGDKGIAPPAETVITSTAHLVTQLHAAGISWRTYQEGISGADCPLTDVLPYAVRHNPFVYFHDVTDGGAGNSPNCIAHVRPYSELAGDLNRKSAARYNFITPNLCNDMHSTCAPLNNPVRQGDTWLSQAIPPLLDSAQYRSGGAIFITWDEGNIGGPIGMIVLSPYGKPGYSNSTMYTHSSTLRTMQEIFAVRPFLGAAAQSNDLAGLFTQLVVQIILTRTSVKLGQLQTVRVRAPTGTHLAISVVYPGGTVAHHLAVSGHSGAVSWHFRQPPAARRGVVRLTVNAINGAQHRSVATTYHLR